MQILNISVMNRGAKYLTTVPYTYIYAAPISVDAIGARVLMRYMGVYPLGNLVNTPSGARVVLRSILVKTTFSSAVAQTQPVGAKVIVRSLLRRMSAPPDGFAQTLPTGGKVVLRRLLVKYEVEPNSFDMTQPYGSKVIVGVE